MRCLSYAEAFRQKSASGRLYTVFHVFWCRQSDLPAASGRTGRYQPLACLCGPCRQRRRPAHCGRGGCGTGRRSGQACRPGASGVRHGVHHSGVSFHRALPCHSPHGKHLVPDAGAADRRRYRAAAGLLGAVFCSGLSGGAAAGKAYRLAGPHPLPLPDRAHRDAVCRVSHPSAGGTLRHTQRRVRSPARCAGHPVRLPDHGHAGRAEFWRGHRPEHPRPGCHRKPCRGRRHHPGRFYCRRADAGGLRHAGPRRGRDRHGVSGPCHRCRGAHRSGTAAVRPGGPCAHCGHFCDRMLQHLRGPDRLCGAVFSSASAPHPLPCPCRFFCCGQYAGIEPRPCCHHPAVHSGAERHLSRSHRADPAFLYAGP